MLCETGSTGFRTADVAAAVFCEDWDVGTLWDTGIAGGAVVDGKETSNGDAVSVNIDPKYAIKSGHL